jgi:hypothetical protein
MTWATPKFTIGGVPIEVPQSLSLTCAYEDQGGVQTLRMGSGRPLRKSYWTRVKMTVTCEGLVPAGLSGLDWTVPLTVQAPSPRSTYAVSNSIALPAARRSDAAPTALAWVDGYPRPTPVTLNGNTATAAPVANATGYTFAYHPEFSALVTKTESADRTNGTFSWNITAEEV